MLHPLDMLHPFGHATCHMHMLHPLCMLHSLTLPPLLTLLRPLTQERCIDLLHGRNPVALMVRKEGG
jgi:hypothetical protein